MHIIYFCVDCYSCCSVTCSYYFYFIERPARSIIKKIKGESNEVINKVNKNIYS